MLLSIHQINAQKIDTKNSKIEFNVINRGVKVTGSILNIKGEVNFDKKDVSGSDFNAKADISTINTNNDGRDKHLLKADFFFKDKFPEISMQSTSIKATDEGYNADCILKIKDFESKLNIDFKVEEKDNIQILTSEFKLNRLDYDLGQKISEKSVAFDIDVKIVCYVNK